MGISPTPLPIIKEVDMNRDQKTAQVHLTQEVARSQQSLMRLAQAADRAGADALAEAVRRAAIIAVAHIGAVRRG